MVSQDLYNVLYVGLHPQTPEWTHGDELRITAVSWLDFFSFLTFNPVNILFASVYTLKFHNRQKFFRVILFWIWFCLKGFSTTVYRKYKNQLIFIIKNNIDIVNAENEQELEEYIRNKNIDLILVNSWSILPKKITESPRYGSINIHPSKLPKHKGALPTLWVLKSKDTESAITYFLMSEKIDGGGIIGQYEFPVEKSDDWLSLEKKGDVVIKGTIKNIILKYVKGQVAPIQMKSGGSATAKYEEYKEVDFAKEKSDDIYNKINLYPFLEHKCFCWTQINGEKIYFKKIFRQSQKILRPGERRSYFLREYFGCKDGTLYARKFLDLK